MNVGTEGHINSFLGSLRYFGAFIYYIIDLLGHNAILNPFVDIIFFISIVTIVVSVFSIYIYKCINSKNILCFLAVDFSVLITVMNVWFTNILTFPECISLTAIGLCLCLVSLMLYFESKKFYHYIISFIMLVSAIAVYQQFVSVFIIYAVLITSIKVINNQHDTMKQNIVKYVKLVVFIAISSIVYYLLGKLIASGMGLETNERISLTLGSIFENIIYFITHQHSFLKGRGLFDTEILTLSYLISALLWFLSLIVYAKKQKNISKTILVFISFAVAYLSAYLPGLVSTSHGTRTMFALFSVFALLSLSALVLFDNKAIKSILVCIVVMVFVLNVYKTLDMASEQISVNTKEIDYASMIAYEIDKYEKNNSNSIKKISVCYDGNADINSETLYTGYSIEALLKLQLNREISFVEIPKEIYDNNFLGKNWEFYDCDEQLIFNDDTLYLCIY